MIESSWLRALDIGENPALPDTVRGRGSFLAAHNLAALFDGLGDAAQGAGTGGNRRQVFAPPSRRHRR